MRQPAIAICAVAVLGVSVQADIIMSAAGLNTTLKTMERLKGQIETGAKQQRDEALFRIGVEADALASLINDEIASHGMQERALVDLALSRTKELGLSITYNRDKKKFFYDGAAFRRYLTVAPRGAHTAEAEFTLLSYQFYQSTGTDPAALEAGSQAKKQFLARYPKFQANAELSLYLAIDYRDLYRYYRDARDDPKKEKYRLLTRGQYQRIAREHAGTEQASSARQLLQRFDEEVRTQR